MEKVKEGNKHEENLVRLFDMLEADLEGRTDSSSMRLRARSRKRARFCNKTADDLAISQFISVNNELAGVEINLSPSEVADARELIQQALWSYNTLHFDTVQEDIHFEHLLDLWRFGPGASNGTESTHAVDKLHERWGCTTRAEPFVVKLRSCNTYLAARDARRQGSSTFSVRGSKLSTVPKNAEISRTTAKGPVGNMVLQLAAGEYLSRVLRGIGLVIPEQQPKNKVLAWIGSLTGELATLDLSAASDRISLKLVKALLPDAWYRLLTLIREDETEVNGEWVPLNMVGMMGNGFTFPLMTLIITALVWANRAERLSERKRTRPWIDWRCTAVYGDDIIVPTHEYEGLVDLLERSGLKVNTDKSYSTGTFRESCGGDYENGEDITPFYIKKLTTTSEVYVAINQVVDWCAKSGRPPLWRVLHFLRSLIDGPVYRIPEWCNPDEGVLTSQVPRRYKYLRRVQKRKKLRNKYYAMMLLIGGYVEVAGTDLEYMPRPKKKDKVEFEVRKARLPQGFLDGMDPLIRSDSERRTADMLIEMMS